MKSDGSSATYGYSSVIFILFSSEKKVSTRERERERERCVSVLCHTRIKL